VLSEVEFEREPPAFASDGMEEFSLLAVLLVLARGRWLLVKSIAISAIAGIAVALLLPCRYTATTSILAPQQGGSSGAALLAQMGSISSLASGGALGLKNPNDLQVALLKSETVEDAMVKRFTATGGYLHLSLSTARRRLEEQVSIGDAMKDGLIRISVTDSDPRLAAEMANAYVEEFRKSTSTLAVTEASQRRLFFEQQLARSKDDLAGAEEDLKRAEQQTGLIQLDSQARAVIESAAQVSAQIAAKQVQIHVIRSFSTDNNPELQLAEEELGGLRAEQAQMVGSGRGNSGPLIPKGNLQQASMVYVRKLREVRYRETIFDLLARQFEAAKMDEARQGAVLQVVDPALVPDERSSPRRGLIVMGSTCLGLVAALMWILVAEGVAGLARDPVEGGRLKALRQMLALPQAGSNYGRPEVSG